MTCDTFSFAGGPLHRLGCRLGLVRGGTDSLALGVALGAFLWGVLAALAVIQGETDRMFSLSVIGVHVRLLVAIPLFFLCEAWIAPRLAAFFRMIVGSGIVPAREQRKLNDQVSRTNRAIDSSWTEAACLLAAILFSLSASRLHLSGGTAIFDPNRAADLSLGAVWSWIVCLTVFRFLMLRWMWRIALWARLLRRVSNLDLELIATHPDGVAGLGYLEVVHSYFMPLVLGLSAVQAASLAEDLSIGAIRFEAIYPSVAFAIAADAVLFVGPLFIVSGVLWACKLRALDRYMSFGQEYVRSFDAKWLGAGGPPAEPLLGMADLQSLADLGNSLNVVRNMRVVPVSTNLLLHLAVAAALPMLPLLLFKYPLAELATRFVARLTGL